MMELTLDRSNVRIDVRVVELEIIEDRSARMVMHELCALVEEGRVVLVRFYDKVLRVAGRGAGAEVIRHATNQESRCKTRIFENPRKDRAGGRLPVSACHRQHPAVAQHLA